MKHQLSESTELAPGFFEAGEEYYHREEGRFFHVFAVGGAPGGYVHPGGDGLTAFG